jgi:hypothetical protein
MPAACLRSERRPAPQGTASGGDAVIYRDGPDRYTKRMSSMTSMLVGLGLLTFLLAAARLEASPSSHGAGTSELRPIVPPATHARAAVACSVTPRADCLAAGMSRIRVDDHGDDATDRIDWTWKRGAAFPSSDLGDPSTSTDFTVCTYDSAPGGTSLASVLALNASPLWSANAKGWRYSDASGAADGVRQLKLQGGVAHKSSLLLRARGEPIPMPVPAGTTLFSAQPEVRVQLVAASAGLVRACWESVFPHASVRRSDATSFRAVSSAPAPPPKRVFVSSPCYDGAIGGLGAADVECQTLADRAGLVGTYKAWLADAGDGPATRFARAAAPYVLVDGTRVADDWSDLADGSLAHAVALDENGKAPDPAAGCTDEVWTNVNADGSPAIGDGYEFVCQNWTIALYARSALTGDASAVDAAWTDGGAFAMRNCNLLARLYCFEQ